jgi:hypothetical protein
MTAALPVLVGTYLARTHSTHSEMWFDLHKHWCAILAPLCVKWVVFAGL